jgi:fumarate reductase (CoM/CoB) subunit A
VPVQPSTFVSGARLYNGAGERFMEAYDPVRKEASTRDVSARGIFDQIRFGKAVDGGVVLDVSAVPDDVFRHENKKVVERLDPHGIDYRTIQLIIAPEAHFVMGGVLIDEWGAASRPGLYACGETAGGVHGGNRLNSNAVPETQVFGHRAGQAAARYAGAAAPGRLDDGRVARWARRLGAIRDERSDVSVGLKASLTAFRDAMWLGLGIVRTEAGLHKAAAHAAAIAADVAEMPLETLGELVAATELDHLAAAATASTASALLRTESRAAHYRDDHPETDPDWVATVVYASGRAERRALTVDPAEAGRLAPPPVRAPGADEFVE